MTSKEFVQGYVPWDGLRKTLFKGLKFNEYDAITKRFLDIFDYERPEQYVNSLPEMFTQSEGRFPDKVDGDGNLKPGHGFHLSLAAYEYDIVCCICECKQTVSISTSTGRATKKCKGCKRRIEINIVKGEITVTDLAANNSND